MSLHHFRIAFPIPPFSCTNSTIGLLQYAITVSSPDRAVVRLVAPLVIAVLVCSLTSLAPAIEHKNGVRSAAGFMAEVVGRPIRGLLYVFGHALGYLAKGFVKGLRDGSHG